MKQKFIGTWELMSYTMQVEGDQETIYPCGKNPLGFLIYIPDNVSVHIMKSNRQLKEDLLESKIERGENYGGYVGDYEIQNDVVIHYPKVCGFIDFLETPQIRKFKFKENLLMLDCSYYNEDYKNKTTSQLTWKRVNK